MLRLIGFAVVLVVIFGALGYYREWFSVTNVEIQVDQENVDDDTAAFSKAVGEKAQALKDQVAGLWEESEGLTGDAKTQAQKELSELKEKRDRLEKQIEELEGASSDKFEQIKQDLSAALEEVEKEIVEWKEKLGKKNAI